MEKKLRRKFIFVSMSAILIVIGLLIFMINLVSLSSRERDNNAILDYLAANDGVFLTTHLSDKNDKDSEFNFREETSYETRYFSVELDEDGNIVSVNLEHIAAVSEDMAKEYARKAIQSQRIRGYQEDYKYLITEKEDGTLIVFVDCYVSRHLAFNFFIYSLIVSIGGCLLVMFLLFVFSTKAIRPIVKAIEKQKRFITDASHEIKTPLAIISANSEVLELLSGENEWTESIKKQTIRLNDLVKDLLTLSKIEESNRMTFVEMVDLSKVVRQESQPYQTVLLLAKKKLEVEVQEGIIVKGNEETLKRLISILMDNAVKYTDENGTVRVQVKAKGKVCKIEISNTCLETKEKDLQHVFNRFYRIDTSRARKTGGLGIGLSIAYAIVEQHHGRIEAHKEGDNVCFCVTLKSETGKTVTI